MEHGERINNKVTIHYLIELPNKYTRTIQNNVLMQCFTSSERGTRVEVEALQNEDLAPDRIL